MVARATALEKGEQYVQAAALVTDWWMGRPAWSATAARLCTRFTNAIPALVREWQRQAAAPLALDDLATLACPARIVIGQRAHVDIRALARRLTHILPQASLTQVAGARGAAHLTMPHVVDPVIANFVVSSEIAWQSDTMSVAA